MIQLRKWQQKIRTQRVVEDYLSTLLPGYDATAVPYINRSNNFGSSTDYGSASKGTEFLIEPDTTLLTEITFVMYSDTIEFASNSDSRYLRLTIKSNGFVDTYVMQYWTDIMEIANQGFVTTKVGDVVSPAQDDIHLFTATLNFDKPGVVLDGKTDDFLKLESYKIEAEEETQDELGVFHLTVGVKGFRIHDTS